MESRFESQAPGVVRVVGGIDDGTLLRDIEKAVTEASQAVKKQGGKASVTIKLEAQKHSGKHGDQVRWKGEVTAKTPRPARTDVLLYLSDEGELSTRHPDQVEMRSLLKVDGGE